MIPRFVLIALFLIANITLCSPASAQVVGERELDVRAILRKCLHAQSAVDCSTMEVKCKAIYEGKIETGGLLVRSQHSVQYRNGQDVDFKMLTLAGDLQNPKRLAGRVTLKDGRLLAYHDELGQPHTHALMTVKLASGFLFSYLGSPQTGCFLDGYVNGSSQKRLAYLMLSGTPKLNRRDAAIGRRTCYEVESETKYGKIALWIATDSFVVLQFDYKKTASSLFGHKNGEGQTLQEAHGSANQAVTWSAYLQEVETVKIGDQEVAASGRLTLVRTNSRGTAIAEIYEVERSKIDLSPPQAAEAFNIDLIEGATITDHDHRPTQFAWKSKKLELLPK